MSLRPTIIVFLRAPYLGAVKQRLAAGIGMIEARQFYTETTHRLLRRIGPGPRWGPGPLGPGPLVVAT